MLSKAAKQNKMAGKVSTRVSKQNKVEKETICIQRNKLKMKEKENKVLIEVAKQIKMAG